MLGDMETAFQLADEANNLFGKENDNCMLSSLLMTSISDRDSGFQLAVSVSFINLELSM